MQTNTIDNNTAIANLKKLLVSIDWKLLAFLVLFLNIKMPVKVLAVVLIYALQFNFKFGFSFKNSRLPLFYLLIFPIAFIGLLINGNYLNPDYLIVFGTGIGCWLLSLLAIHQVKLLVEKNEPEAIHQTIIAYFVLNAIVSIVNLVLIMLITHNVNPYTFRGMNQMYFINTGDNVMGLTFDISSTNAVLCGMGMIYFLVKNNPVMLFVCAATLFLTYSNLITLTLFLVLLLLLLFKTSRNQKSLLVVCMGMYLVFMFKVSPQNSIYTTEAIANIFHKPKPQPDYDTSLIIKPKVVKPESLLTPEEKKRRFAINYLDSIATQIRQQKQAANTSPVALTAEKILPLINKPVKRTEKDYLSKEMEPDRRRMLDFINAHRASLPMSVHMNPFGALPGKVTGAIQTVTFLYQHPTAIIAGLGIGNFSSKVAFRASGLGIRGRYLKDHLYINPGFMSNHLDLYMSFFSRSVKFRSVKNNPYSVYDQLLSEYGLTGLLALIVFYFGFFAKKNKALTYGLPILLFMAGVFFIDYWFEQLSVVVMFELMLFLNIKESEILTNKLKTSHA